MMNGGNAEKNANSVQNFSSHDTIVPRIMPMAESVVRLWSPSSMMILFSRVGRYFSIRATLSGSTTSSLPPWMARTGASILFYASAISISNNSLKKAFFMGTLSMIVVPLSGYISMPTSFLPGMNTRVMSTGVAISIREAIAVRRMDA